MNKCELEFKCPKFGACTYYKELERSGDVCKYMKYKSWRFCESHLAKVNAAVLFLKSELGDKNVKDYLESVLNEQA